MYMELTPDLSGEHEQIKETVHAFAKEVLRPAARTLDSIPAEQVADHPGFRNALRQAYEMNLHTILVPEGFGGMGLDPLGTHIVLEELAWGSAGFAISIAVSQFPAFGACLLATDNEELIAEFTTPFVENRDGSLIGCWAITEPDHGSDWLTFGGMEGDPGEGIVPNLRAKKVDGGWVLNGQKAAWISNGPVAHHAYLFLNLDPLKGMRGSGIALVDLGSPGVSRGKAWEKLGQRALPQGELYFDDVFVPDENLIANPELYPFAIDATLSIANTAMSALFTGVAQAAFDEAFRHAKERVQGGRALIEHSTVQVSLFEMFKTVEAARALSRRVMVYNYQTITPSLKHAVAAKVFCTDAAVKVAHMAIQVFGGMGVSKESDIEMIFRDARMAQIEDGVNEALAINAGHSLQFMEGE
ncbi:MAG: acyl-CoA/acyl-ACP dehydrogenase [Acidobacteria bacterium]|nr:acyl-CoA/acyl-ACP dehydrogenase [Acidobacteriota bacterium]